MKFSTAALTLLLFTQSTSTRACAPHEVKVVQRQPVIQLAILLDTSNSMDGLIDQARTQLWRVVNEFGTARKGGLQPQLQVALYEYGNDGLPAGTGHIRRVLPFTTDLDKVSEELFALKTNGGNEYCGQVIGEAVKGLQWSNAGGDLKVIFIAGNEEFTQGTVDYRNSVKTAIANGIIVNTIFCGDRTQGLQTQWGSGAQLAEGRYVAIDQNAEVAEIDAPQDEEIARLGAKLNETYIAYGMEGAKGSSRQWTQDKNLALKKGANIQRQIAKTSANYTNASWDLVDASKSGKVDVAKVKTADLPAEMRGMTVEQRKEHVRLTEKKRTDLKARIATLDTARKTYIAAQRKNVPPAASTLDEAIISAVREAGRKRGFTF
ncbi:MAG TPA: vWA domain-containing protein [Thermoanaerobaculia bacterium]|nr:vWA domain-containing protein [Thermoanaerobaculia bacterium]